MEYKFIKKIGLKQILLGAGLTIIFSSLVLMGLSKLFAVDIYNWLTLLKPEGFENIIITYLKIQLLFGIILFLFSSSYTYYVAHIKKY